MPPVCCLSLEPRAIMLPSPMSQASSMQAKMRSSTVASFAVMRREPPWCWQSQNLELITSMSDFSLALVVSFVHSEIILILDRLLLISVSKERPASGGVRDKWHAGERGGGIASGSPQERLVSHVARDPSTRHGAGLRESR